VVDIGGANATNVVLTGSTFLSTTVPDGSSTGYVTVTTGPTTLFCNKPFKVKPVISTFSPTSGPVGTIVTINGTGLASTISVKFASHRAHFTVVSNDQITATVPSGAITGKISVTTNSGTATSAGVFTVQ